MNSQRLQQNHPCVIDIIRRNYLYPPADHDVEYDLRFPEKIDPSMGQAALRRNHFNNQVKHSSNFLKEFFLLIIPVGIEDEGIFRRMRSLQRRGLFQYVVHGTLPKLDGNFDRTHSTSLHRDHGSRPEGTFPSGLPQRRSLSVPSRFQSIEFHEQHQTAEYHRSSQHGTR